MDRDPPTVDAYKRGLREAMEIVERHKRESTGYTFGPMKRAFAYILADIKAKLEEVGDGE